MIRSPFFDLLIYLFFARSEFRGVVKPLDQDIFTFAVDVDVSLNFLLTTD